MTRSTPIVPTNVLGELLTNKDAIVPQFIFVGGKGGVGKTSTSSALSVALSNKGFRTLIVSTDPAHSLGDALDENLRSGLVRPIVTEPSLWALEIDVDAALEDFKKSADDLNSESISRTLGVPKDIIDSLGLEDLASLFTNPPPGIDEIVALIKIFEYADERLENGSPKYERIVRQRIISLCFTIMVFKFSSVDYRHRPYWSYSAALAAA
jgi:arsenite-transporting ATPase